jgi:signal transduction histidine kinase
MEYKRFIVPLFLLMFFINVNNAFCSNPDSLILELSKEQNDTLKFDILLSIGDLFEYSQPDSAIVYYTMAANLADVNIANDKKYQIKFQQLKGKALRYIGYVHLNQGDYQLATQFYFEALEIAEGMNDKNSIYNCYNNIGIINHMQKEYNVAKAYYNKALDILEERNDRIGKSKLFINIGNLYHDHGDNIEDLNLKNEYYSLALNYYSEALSIKTDIGDKKGQSLCFNNLGNLHKKMANLSVDETAKRKTYLLSRDYYNKSLKVSESINDKAGLSLAYGNLSDLYSTLHKKNWFDVSQNRIYADSAIHFGLKSYHLALEINSVYLQSKTALLLRSNYSGIGDMTKALEFADIYIETRDRMFSEEKTKALKEMMTKYETAKKDNEIRFLNQQSALKEAIIKNANKERIIYIMIAVFFLVLSTLLLKLYSNRKESNLKLEEKNNQLHTLNSTKDKFISILAHDLKNPFSAFCNIANALKESYDEIDEKEKKHLIDQISESSTKLNSLLKNMLEWASVQKGSPFNSNECINLFSITDDIKNNLNSFAKEQRVNIVNSIPKEILVCSNTPYLYTVLTNLITNGVKFSKIDDEVTITANPLGGFVEVTVNDNGVGISEEDLPKLFRIDIDIKSIGNGNSKGTGLGLILCKDILDKINGKIWVESKVNVGSKFKFTLPAYSENCCETFSK